MDPEKEAVRASCARFLTHHPPERFAPRNWFRELAESVDASAAPDHYGDGALVQSFEREVAELLGKEAALFVPSGTMAQQIALRIWTGRNHVPRVAFHPTCHLEIHEHSAYRVLHGLESVLVGPRDGLITLSDLEAVQEPLGALLIELPQRAIGGQLPAWEELEAIAEWAKTRDVTLHLDGARLWEAQPFYARPYAEIVAPFRSVYVSFYKILGGIAGAALAGPEDFIDEARIWRRRHGGALVHLFPMVLSARAGMRERLPKIASYCEKARETAAALQQVVGVEVIPSPPHANMMHVFLRGDRAELETAALDFAREFGIWLFGALTPTPLPTLHRFELTVGDATLELSTREIVSAFGALLHS
jgi:threonine aldolase